MRGQCHVNDDVALQRMSLTSSAKVSVDPVKAQPITMWIFNAITRQLSPS
jgi:hypothetical protein